MHLEVYSEQAKLTQGLDQKLPMLQCWWAVLAERDVEPCDLSCKRCCCRRTYRPEEQGDGHR